MSNDKVKLELLMDTALEISSVLTAYHELCKRETLKAADIRDANAAAVHFATWGQRRVASGEALRDWQAAMSGP